MKFETKYKLILHKTYFDVGFGLTNYIKYLILLFGIASIGMESIPTEWAIAAAFIWGFGCYFLGRWWYVKGWIYAQAEVGNQFNYFQKEMRKAIENEKFK